MSDILDLPLKKEWYEKIESGQKTEEYRVIKPYWIKRFCFASHNGDCKRTQCECAECFKLALAYEGFVCHPYTHVRFRYGYTKRTMLREIESMRIGYGKPEWGAPIDKQVFIIRFKKGGDDE